MSLPIGRTNLVELVKFLFVGGGNFMLTLVLFYVFVSIWHLDPIFSIAAVSLIGLLFTYYLNHTWVFLPGDKLDFRKNLIRYAAANGFSIVANMILLRVLLVTTELSAFFAQLILVPFLVALNFVTAKFWSLRRREGESE